MECGASPVDPTLPLVEGGRVERGKCGELIAHRMGVGLPRTHAREVGRWQELAPITH